MKIRALAIACALTLPVLCSAAVIATAQNNAGGKIMLTDERGDCPAGTLLLVGTSRGGEFIGGCWQYVAPVLLVIFSNGGRRIFDPNEFKGVTPDPSASESQ